MGQLRKVCHTVLSFLLFLKVKFRETSAMLVAYLIYYEFWLVLLCWQVGPGIEEVPFGLVFHTVLYFLFVFPEGKRQRDFCNASCLSDLL